jgi:hypothetical protein
MHRSFLMGLAVIGAGCASGAPNVETAVAPDCREFKAPVMIEGQSQELVGLACQQPDGTWTPVEIPLPYALPAYEAGAGVPDMAIAPNCAYPMAAQYTKECNLYLRRPRGRHR